MTMPPAFAKRDRVLPHQTIRQAHLSRFATHGDVDQHAAARMGSVASRR